MGDSPIINVLVYTHNSCSPVTLPIFIHFCRRFTKTFVEVHTSSGGSPIDNVMVYKPVGGSPVTLLKVYTPKQWVISNII